MYYKWEGVISSKECEEIITEYKDKELVEAKTTDGDEDEARCALIHWVDKESMLTRMVMSFMTEANERFFGYKIDGSEAVQFGKYDEGDKYDWRMDALNTSQQTIRKLTTVIQLSDPDDYEGGDFQLFAGEKDPEDLNIRSQGSVIVFDSRDWHRLTSITEGTRYSLAQWRQGSKFQ